MKQGKNIRYAVAAAVVLVFALAWLLRNPQPGSAAGKPAAPAALPATPPQRLISLAPSMTEILFALGLGERVVGTTRYCNYPPAAAKTTRIGGYHDPNYEAMLALRPDLVVMLPEHQGPREYLSRTGIATLALNQSTVSEIFTTIETLGRVCGVPERAATLNRRLRERLDLVRQHTRGLKPASIMIVVGRDLTAPAIKDLIIAGGGGWYNELVEAAGGVNVYSGSILFPAVSAEGVMKMNPEVIADMLGDMSGKEQDSARLRSGWESLPQVRAVQAGRVHQFKENYAVVPGPRFIQVLEDLARILQPGVDWDAVLAAPAPDTITAPATASPDAGGGK